MIISEKEFKEQYTADFENTHDEVACSALKHYYEQLDYKDGSPKPALERKDFTYFMHLYNRSRNQILEHRRCINEDK